MTLLLLLTGASGTASPVFTGLYQTTVRRKIEALDVEKREGVTATDPAQVRRKIEALKVDRSG